MNSKIIRMLILVSGTGTLINSWKQEPSLCLNWCVRFHDRHIMLLSLASCTWPASENGQCAAGVGQERKSHPAFVHQLCLCCLPASSTIQQGALCSLLQRFNVLCRCTEF